MLSKRQKATVIYALHYLSANYDDAIAYDEPANVSEMFQQHAPLTEEEIIKLADSLTIEKWYRLEVSGQNLRNKISRTLISRERWLTPEEALSHQQKFVDSVCNSSMQTSLNKDTIKIRVVESNFYS